MIIFTPHIHVSRLTYGVNDCACFLFLQSPISKMESSSETFSENYCHVKKLAHEMIAYNRTPKTDFSEDSEFLEKCQLQKFLRNTSTLL